MKTKNIIIILFTLGVPVLMSTIIIKTSGAHPGSTGAPGELTCAKSGCHANASVSTGTGINTFIWPNADSTYVPGQTYSVQVQVQKTGILKFGFELTVLKDSNNREVGTLVVTDTVRTHLINAIIGGQNRKSITHSTAGTPAITTGNTSWGFNWVAPSTDVGTITFYYATNCTNNNGQNTGDAIYLSSFQIKPKVIGIDEANIDKNSFNASYEKENNSLNVSYKLNRKTNVVLQITDLQGKIIISNAINNSNTLGSITESINLPSSLSQGYYNISLVTKSEIVSKKLLIQ